jgi:hypothetical protein
MTLKQKICSNKSVMHTKCCQTPKLAAGTTDSVTLAFLVLVQAAGQTHSAVAVSVTFLRLSLAVVVAGVGKQVHHVDKILRSRLA